MENKDIFQVDQRAVKLVDTREPEIIRTKLLETGWQQKYLYTADFAFLTHEYHKVGVTRKSMSDLLNSINEIWAKQLEGMLEYYDVNIILIEGSWANVRPSVILGSNGISYLTWDMVWNYLRRWQDKGFSLELTIDIKHTVDRLNKLYALYQKPYSLASMTNKFADDRVLAFPSGTRGKTAQQILDNGKSLVDIGQMSIEELKAYDKIGDKKAQLIRSHFNRRTDNAKRTENKTDDN